MNFFWPWHQSPPIRIFTLKIIWFFEGSCGIGPSGRVRPAKPAWSRPHLFPDQSVSFMACPRPSGLHKNSTRTLEEPNLRSE
jgi:hypothetical protein